VKQARLAVLGDPVGEKLGGRNLDFIEKVSIEDTTL
jgi:hypothetical protein